MSNIMLRLPIVISILTMSAGVIADPIANEPVANKAADKTPVSAKPAAVDGRHQNEVNKSRDQKGMDSMPATAAPMNPALVDSVPSIHRPPPTPTDGAVVKEQMPE
jgi:hypothetical protein